MLTAFSQFPAVVLTGARQTGKTSLARHLLPEADYVTFDIPLHANFARTDPAGFLDRYSEPLILDETRFLRACAARTGQLLSMAEIALDVGVAPNTAKSWISILQASKQIILLLPSSTNLGKRLIKTPKLYFGDTGLLLYLLDSLGTSAPVRTAGRARARRLRG